MLMPVSKSMEGPVYYENMALAELKNELTLGRVEAALALLAWAVICIAITSWAVMAKEHTRASAVSE